MKRDEIEKNIYIRFGSRFIFDPMVRISSK
jgi:hypothetical protein